MNWTPPPLAKTMSERERAHAAIRIGCYVFPAREKTEQIGDRTFAIKTPYTRSGHLEATNDPSKIDEWWSMWPEALVAVNAGMSGIVCLDIDMGEDDRTGETHDGWNSLIEAGLDDLPETFMYRTRRGGDHALYLDPGNVRLGPTQDHTTPDGVKLADVDRRAGSSFFLLWSDEIPSDRTVFRPAPEWLLTPSLATDADPYLGSVSEWFESIPEGEPNQAMLTRMGEIPTGEDFNRSEMLRLQATFVALAAHGDTGGKYALQALKDEWLRIPWNTPEYRLDWDRGLRGAIQKYGSNDKPPLLEDFGILEAQSRLPSTLPDGRDFLTEGIAGLPANDTPGALWSHRSKIIKALLGAGFTDQEIATLIWMAPSARSLHEDLDGIRKLWGEIDEARAESVAAEAKESGVGIAPAPASERPNRTKQKVELLTLQERALVEGDAAYEWFGTRYIDHFRETLPMMSEPYFRLLRWILLAGVFGNLAVIPRNGESDLKLNIYGKMAGPTTSGKSEALEPVLEIWNNVFQGGYKNPSIGGGQATQQGLTKKLIDRDGCTSVYHPDEADRVIHGWKNEMGPYHGVKQLVMQLFNGTVTGDLLAGRSEDAGKRVDAYLSIVLTGVPERILAQLEPDDWTSGFENRFVWVVGNKLPRTGKARRFNHRRPDQTQAPKPKMTAYFAAELANAAAKIARTDNRLVEMDIEDAVLDRDEALTDTLISLWQGSRYAAQLEATFQRLEATIMKCAALVALSEGRKKITMRDYLIAVHQGEEFATNHLEMVARTDESPWIKNMNFIEAMIAEQSDQFMPRAKVYREMAMLQQTKRDVDELLGNLVAQGRVEIRQRADTGEQVVVLKEGAS